MRSVQRELNSFYQKVTDSEFSIQYVTKGAFTQARAKLKPEAFEELNEVGLASFYRNAPYRKWHDFRLLAVDGSTLVLPKHQTVEQEFGVVKFGPYKDSPRSIGRLSMLYDVLNFTTLDVQLGKYTSSERELLYKHLPAVSPTKDLLLLDRGYPSVPLMFVLRALKIDYCIRMRDDWWLTVRAMLENGETDKLVRFELPEKDKHLTNKYAGMPNDITCRLIVVDLPKGEPAIFCTSLTDGKSFPRECFDELYHYRWNIEEGFKLYKSRVQLEAFSGKTAKAVKQDIYAKAFMMTTMAVLAFPIEQKLRSEYQQSTRKHPHQPNRTNALAMVKECIHKFLIHKRIQQALKAFDAIIQRTTEIVRPNRSFERKKLKKKPPSMNYKQL